MQFCYSFLHEILFAFPSSYRIYKHKDIYGFMKSRLCVFQVSSPFTSAHPRWSWFDFSYSTSRLCCNFPIVHLAAMICSNVATFTDSVLSEQTFCFLNYFSQWRLFDSSQRLKSQLPFHCPRCSPSIKKVRCKSLTFVSLLCILSTVSCLLDFTHINKSADRCETAWDGNSRLHIHCNGLIRSPLFTVGCMFQIFGLFYSSFKCSVFFV